MSTFSYLICMYVCLFVLSGFCEQHKRELEKEREREELEEMEKERVNIIIIYMYV